MSRFTSLAIAAAAVLLPLAGPVLAAGGAHTQVAPTEDDGLTPAERMEKRFPQKVRVGDLEGLPLLDFDDRTLGRVTAVARTAEGGIVLVVPVGGWFGSGGRPVAVPIEAVAILGRQIALLDIDRDDLPEQATWTATAGTPVPADETIRIAITRR